MNLRRNIAIAVVGMLLCWPAWVQAQVVGDTIDRADSLADGAALDGLVITAQYQPGSASQSVHKVHVIGAAKIQAMGAQNLRDALTNELNVRISQDNILGSGVSLQGISGQNVKVLVDGVAVIGRLDGNIDLSQLSMKDVERIEVVEGPLSVSYGTDALAGTINIITKKAQQKKLAVAADSYYESNGHYNLSGRLGWWKGKNMGSVSGGRYYFDGWQQGDQPFDYVVRALADSSRFQSWKPKEQLFGRAYWGRYFGALKWGYTGDLFLENIVNRGLPRLPYQETAFDDRYRTWRMTHATSLVGAVGKKHHLSVQAATNLYRRTKNTWFKDLTTLEEVLSADPSEQDTSQLWDHSSRGTLSSTRQAARWNYELGYDAHLETAAGARIAEGLRQLGEAALFGSMEVTPFKGLVLRPGLRYGYNSVYRAPLVPSLNLKYAKGRFTTRAAYARGFRAPSLKELYFVFVDINHDITGNAALKAEVSNNFSLSTVYAPALRKGKLNLEVAAFHNSIHHLITLAQVAGNSYMYVNVGEYQTHGVQAKAELVRGKSIVSLGGGITGRLNAIPDSVAAPRFGYSPELRASWMLEFKRIGLKAALFYKFTGRLPSFALGADGEVLTQQIGAYHMADASLNRNFWKGRLAAGLGVKNLLNVQRVNATASSGMHGNTGNSLQVGTGRSYFLQLGINLQSEH